VSNAPAAARYALGGVRLVMGSTALVAPSTMVRRLGGKPEQQTQAAYPWRLFGVRTVVLAGELLLSRPGPVRDHAVTLAPFIHAADLGAAVVAGRTGRLSPRAARTAAALSGLNTVLALLARADRSG
jgi:hypothetical protein